MTDDEVRRLEDEAREVMGIQGGTYGAACARAMAEGVLELIAHARLLAAPSVVASGEDPIRLTMAGGLVAYAAVSRPDGRAQGVRFEPPISADEAEKVLDAVGTRPSHAAVAAVAVLNAALAADREAVKTLLEFRVPCNAALGAHPTIQVRRGPPHSVGILGILNGCYGAVPDGPRKGWGWITLLTDEQGPVRFKVTDVAPGD